MGFDSTAARSGRRRLIINADDFGRSSSINHAIVRAHREGVLTTASLMVNEAAAEEAVLMARENPSLGVGLHLTLLCGHSALPAANIPGLVNQKNEFTDNPVAAGFRYFFDRRLREPLREEIHAQFKRFHDTGLTLDHVNGHLHLHLHPVVFRILMNDAVDLGIKRVRLTRDPFRLNLGLASGRLFYRASHAFIFQTLAAMARPGLARRGFKFTNWVFGLLQNARVNEQFISRLLARLPAGDSELYSHPSLDEFKEEFEALVSPRVRHQVKALGIELIRYQDL
jgi:hopanoid biosynthesis associated protein HpnK